VPGGKRVRPSPLKINIVLLGKDRVEKEVKSGRGYTARVGPAGGGGGGGVGPKWMTRQKRFTGPVEWKRGKKGDAGKETGCCKRIKNDLGWVWGGQKKKPG